MNEIHYLIKKIVIYAVITVLVGASPTLIRWFAYPDHLNSYASGV